MDAQGNIIKTEVDIELNQLPTGVLDYVKTHYAGKQAKEGAKITDAEGTVTYEVEIKGMDLIFDINGKFIKEVKKDKKKERNADKNSFNIFNTCRYGFNIASSNFGGYPIRFNKR